MLILFCYIHIISYSEILFLILYPSTMAFSSITAPGGWPDLIASRIPPGLLNEAINLSSLINSQFNQLMN